MSLDYGSNVSRAMRRKLRVNKQSQRKCILVQCSTPVGRKAVTRTSVDGVEHIVISSHTLPDDIIMNGLLYPAEEIAASFKSLERTLAPVEHPSDAQGNFISASDPAAIHNFYAGAFNTNVRQEDGRVVVDKVINVQEALKTDRGKRLLDRVDELENSADPRPIHTSVGVFLEVEETDGPQTNDQGQEFTGIARNMVFDHDAILLESVGAAQPHQGVGMGVNADGEEVEVQRGVIAQDLVTIPADDLEDLSHNQLEQLLFDAVNTPPLRADWVVDVFDDRVIYVLGDQFFSVPYTVGNGVVTITGIPVPVERDVSFVPKTNQKGDAMKELMLKALADAGVTVNAEITDAELMVKYNALLATQNSSDDDGASDNTADLADVVANALKPLAERLDGLEAKINEKDTAEADRLAEIVGNSDKYPGLDADAAKKLDMDTLTSMAANCASAHGIPLTIVNSGSGGEKPIAMPE